MHFRNVVLLQSAKVIMPKFEINKAWDDMEGFHFCFDLERKKQKYNSFGKGHCLALRSQTFEPQTFYFCLALIL